MPGILETNRECSVIVEKYGTLSTAVVTQLFLLHLERAGAVGQYFRAQNLVRFELRIRKTQFDNDLCEGLSGVSFGLQTLTSSLSVCEGQLQRTGR